jgi:hypothetical protein
VIIRQGNQQQINGIEHNLDAHKKYDDVAAGKHTQYTYRKQNNA